MTNYEERIKRGLILYLRERHNIGAIDAYIGESEVEEGYGGCGTCGYGGIETTVTVPLFYKEEGVKYYGQLDLEGYDSSLNFLPVLLEYIDRAN